MLLYATSRKNKLAERATHTLKNSTASKLDYSSSEEESIKPNVIYDVPEDVMENPVIVSESYAKSINSDIESEEPSIIKANVMRLYNALIEKDYSDGEEYMIDKDSLKDYISSYIPNGVRDFRPTGQTRETLKAYRADKVMSFILKVDNTTYELNLGKENKISCIKNRIK